MGVQSLQVGAASPTTARCSVELDGTNATLVVSTSPDLSSPLTFGPAAKNGSGFAILTATGLSPATDYHFGAREDGVLDATIKGKFRTPGPAGTPQNMLIASSGCAQGTNYPGSTPKVSNSPIFDTIRAWDPDMFVGLGDHHYRNINSNDIALYRQAYKDMLAEPRQNQFWREMAIATVWDDHEWANNDSDSTALGAAEVSQVYREVFPSYTLPDASTTGAIYHSWERGRILNIISDTRHDRVPGVTMLGAAQKAWMEAVLTGSSAEFLVWWNPTPWMGGSADTWAGFVDERDEIRDLFRSLGWEDRMVCVNADYHGLAMDTGTGNEARTGATFPVYLWCALDSGVESGETGSTQYDMGTASVGSNRYGLLRISDDGDLITVTGTAYISTTPWRSNTQHIITSEGTVPPRELSLLYDDDLSRIRITSSESAPFDALEDTFDRTESNGWGTSDSGHPWVVSGAPAGNFSVSTGRGRMGLTPVSVRHFALNDAAYADVEYLSSFIVPATAAGGDIGGAFHIRTQDTANYYMAQILFKPTGVLHLDLYKAVAGAHTALVTGVDLTTGYSGAARVNVRVKAEGPVISVKAWNNTVAEPASYTLVASDPDYTTGRIGVSAVLFSTNTNTQPVAVSVEDLMVQPPADVFLRVDRSTDQITWQTVRGALAVPAPAGMPVTVDDYEFVPDVPNYYRVTVLDAGGNEMGSQIAVTTPQMESVWLKSPSRPFLNQKVAVVDMGEVTRPTKSTVFPIAGAARGVAVADVRAGRQFDLQLLTDTLADKDDLEAILSLGEALLVHVPAACPIPVPTMYASVGDTTYARPGRLSPIHVITLPMTEVEAPGPDVVGVTVTWNGVQAAYATWDDVVADNPTWADLMNRIGTPADVVT